MSKYLSKILILTLCFISIDVKAADTIRYTEYYEMYTQDSNYLPSNDEIQEWFNIDLPLDDNNNPLYTLEFDYSEVDFTKEGNYTIVLTFYKVADHKYQKEFKLHLKDYVPEETETFGTIEKFYLTRIGTVSAIGLALYIVVAWFLKQTQRRCKYVIIIDNKFLKIIKRRETPSIEKIKKIIKKDNIISYFILDRIDIPDYLEKMIHLKKYDYVIEIKTK